MKMTPGAKSEGNPFHLQAFVVELLAEKSPFHLCRSSGLLKKLILQNHLGVCEAPLKVAFVHSRVKYLFLCFILD